MKVSRNWLQEYLDFELPGVDELVQKIGAQLGAVEEVIDVGKKYEGIVIVKVISCEPHPNADKLQLCTIDDGKKVADIERTEGGYVQVVCGAPNVAVGQFVAWLPPGRTVPSSFDEHEPFVLEAREIRGQVSNGMLASPKELAISDSHEGLLVLNEDAEPEVQANEVVRQSPTIKPGDDFAKTYALDDYIIDIENKMFTHRPDCFGILGIAREVAGILGKQFVSPAIYLNAPSVEETATDTLVIDNELPELVPRFTAQVFQNITIGPSPVWMQTMLTRVGVRPINNIVDITNYYMVLTGQPLHAYDFDKLRKIDNSESATLTIRHPKKGEKLTLLNGKIIEPIQSDIMIASAATLVGNGGVKGGGDTEVDEQTKAIVLECAQFDMFSVRRTAMTHGLFTDAVTRFSKGQSPLQNDKVVAWTRAQLLNISGVAPGAYVDDVNLDKYVTTRNSLYPSLEVSPSFIQRRLGIDLTADDITSLLTHVEFSVESNRNEKDELLTVTAPFWRTDIELPEDIVEEVGRLYGYDKLHLELPSRTINPAQKDQLLMLKHVVRKKLATAGANEVLTYSFVHGELLKKVGQDPEKAFQISNALSPDLQYYRLSLMPSLLDKVHMNMKAGFKEFALFEIGKTHSTDHMRDDTLPGEFEFTGLVVVADDIIKKTGAAYYEAKALLEHLVGHEHLTYKPVSKDMQEYPVTQPYNYDRSALVSLKDGEFLGIIGEFKPSVIRALKLPNYSAGFEIDTEALGRIMTKMPGYIPLNKFPSVKQDMTIAVDANMAYETVYDAVQKAYAYHGLDETHIKLELIDIYQNEADTSHKHLTFRFTTTGQNRTLTDKEVASVLDKIADSLQSEINATRI